MERIITHFSTSLGFTDKQRHLTSNNKTTTTTHSVSVYLAGFILFLILTMYWLSQYPLWFTMGQTIIYICFIMVYSFEKRCYCALSRVYKVAVIMIHQGLLLFIFVAKKNCFWTTFQLQWAAEMSKCLSSPPLSNTPEDPLPISNPKKVNT